MQTHADEIKNNPSVAKSAKIKLNDRSNGRPLKVLSEEDWQFWVHNGYVVIKNVVPAEQIERLVQVIWEFEEKDPHNPATWYAAPRAEMAMKELVGTGMVEIYHHQYLWDNRQTPRVYDAFSDIWGVDELWVTIDRANLNMPLRPHDTFKGFIHWDYDPQTNPQNVQGVLALNDQTDERVGGFQCIPELFRNYESWAMTQPTDRDYFKPDIRGYEDKIVKVKMEAGDLLIFHSMQPHGIRPNFSGQKVRLAQYISMIPAEEENTELRNWRINSWRERITPRGYAFPGDPRHWEQQHYPAAQLSGLGRKLLGLDAWF